MSVGGAAEGRLALALRALFAPMLSQYAGPAPAPAPDAPAVGGGALAGGGTTAPRMLSGPPATGAEPAPARPPAGTPVRQAGIFDPPGPQTGSQALFLEDFTARFQETMRKGGVAARDPLHPVLTMLGEMLVRFTHLQADHTGVARRAADHLARCLQEEGARVQATVAEQGREIARTVGQGAGRIEAAAAEVKKGREDVVRGFRTDTEALLLKAFATQSRAYTWNTWVYTATMLALALVVLAGGGYWYGRHVEREDMALVLEATKTPLVAAVLRDGRAVAEHWLHLMQWNHLDQAGRTCEPQQNGIGYRMVCNYILWDSQPLDTPPAPSIANPK